MSISFTRIKKIEDIASEIIRSENLNNPNVPVKKIAKKLGVSVINYDLGPEMSGILVINKDHGTIGINPAHSEQRQRFTIAHELGHFILHKNDHNDIFVDKDFIVKYRSNKPYTEIELRQEQEANAFAAALLMPKEFILTELAKNDYYSDLSEVQLIDALSKSFKVSVPAMTYRLSNLNLFV
jgi:Zn-dependent peptidase ImmA (M78 family)